MNDAQLLHVFEATHQLDSEASDKVVIETVEVVYLQEFEEVHA